MHNYRYSQYLGWPDTRKYRYPQYVGWPDLENLCKFMSFFGIFLLNVKSVGPIFSIF